LTPPALAREIESMSGAASELELKAERAVRRGELLTALELFDELLAMQPGDERLQKRMDSVRALLQPTETDDRGPQSDDVEGTQETASLTDAEQGELHASAGRFAQAVGCYEVAAAAAPENELLRERLQELRELVAPGAPADLAAAEHIPAPAPRHAAARPESRSHRVAHSNFAPIDERPASPLPKDPVKLLETLLDRVRAARR
jgi:tetratricopeptide (TPR) repeat protein